MGGIKVAFEMKIFIGYLAIFLSAIISSMGLGGGSVYILYLTLFTDTQQLTAQGQNLLLFVPCALTSIIIYTHKKIIKYKQISLMLLGGLIGVGIGYAFIFKIDSAIIRKIFAAFLIISGLVSLVSTIKKK